MAKINEKCRLCRREGVKLFLKGPRCLSPKCPLEKRGAVPPGMHGLKSATKRQSAYGKQLREKQKVKRLYGIAERQLKNYFKKAYQQKGATSLNLLRLLELRFDNVLYLLRLVPSRPTAKQIIRHGFVKVNGKKMTIPSFSLKVGSDVMLGEKAVKMPKIQGWLAKQEGEAPKWLEKQGTAGKVIRLPERDEIPNEIAENLIIEFYLR